MPIKCQIQLKTTGDIQHHDAPSAPGLNNLIRAALETSDTEAAATHSTESRDTRVPAVASGLINALENSSSGKESSESGSKKKPTVSDDDHGLKKKKRKQKLVEEEKNVSTKKMKAGEVPAPSARTIEDFSNTIDEACREQRIDEKKALRLQECVQSGDWSEVAFNLLCEQIPLKRKGKGYSCRICLVPKKGHNCPYCPVCSNSVHKFKKDDDHVCFNCITCFEVGRRKKKLVQVKSQGHRCRHGASSLLPS